MIHPGERTLNDFIDGVLAAGEQAEVEEHLERCAECALLVADVRRVISDAASLPPIAPPTRAWMSLVARLDEPAAIESSVLSGFPVRRSTDSPPEGGPVASKRQRRDGGSRNKSVAIL